MPFTHNYNPEHLIIAFISHDIVESIVYLPDYNMHHCTRHESTMPILELKNYLRLNSDHKLSPSKMAARFQSFPSEGWIIEENA